MVYLLSRHIVSSGPLCALGDHSCGGGGWGCDSCVGGAVGAVDAGTGLLAVAAQQAGVAGPQDGPGGAAVWPRPGLRRVGEGQCGGVDDAVVPHQRDGHLDGLPHPTPALTEGWDVGHHTQHALRTPVCVWRWRSDTQSLRILSITQFRSLIHSYFVPFGFNIKSFCFKMKSKTWSFTIAHRWRQITVRSKEEHETETH